MSKEKKLYVYTQCLCTLKKHHFKNKGLDLNVSPHISLPTFILHSLATYKWILGKPEIVWWPLNCYRTHHLPVLSIPSLEYSLLFS